MPVGPLKVNSLVDRFSAFRVVDGTRLAVIAAPHEPGAPVPFCPKATLARDYGRVG